MNINWCNELLPSVHVSARAAEFCCNCRSEVETVLGPVVLVKLSLSAFQNRWLKPLLIRDLIP